MLQECRSKDVFDWVKYDGRPIPGICTCYMGPPHLHISMNEIFMENEVWELKLGYYIIYNHPLPLVKEILTEEEFKESYESV